MGHSLLDLFELQHIYKRHEYDLEIEYYDLTPMIGNYHGQSFFSLIEEDESLYEKVSNFVGTMDNRESNGFNLELIKRLLQYVLKTPQRTIYYHENQ